MTDDPWDWDDEPEEGEGAEVVAAAADPPLPATDGEVVSTLASQRLGSHRGSGHQRALVMEQTYREFTVADVDTALDLLLELYRGRNVFEEVRRALLSRAMVRMGGVQSRAASLLGCSARTVHHHYHKQETLAVLPEELRPGYVDG